MKKLTSVKPVNLALTVLFCAGLIVVFTALLFVPDREFSVTEKRVLTLFPKATFSSVADGSFERDVEKYLQDQVPFRNFFVGVASYTGQLLGQNGTEGVYRCRDDYLINTPVELDEKKLSNNLKRLNDFVRDFDVEKYMMIVPQTGYVMEDKLPKKHAEYNDDEVFDFIRDKADEFTFVDLRQTFKEQKDSVQLYYRTDHHWTMDGAFIGMNEFLKAAGKQTVEKNSFSSEKHTGFYGTTHSSSALWLTPPDDMELWRYNAADISVTVRDIGVDTVTTRNDVYFTEHLTEYDMYPVYLNGNHSFTHIVNNNADGGAILIIKDSFGNSLASQLVSSYKDIIMVDLRYYRTQAVSDIMVEYPIDTVLINYGLDNLINDTNFIWLR